jgi:hypothetical protein
VLWAKVEVELSTVDVILLLLLTPTVANTGYAAAQFVVVVTDTAKTIIKATLITIVHLYIYRRENM